MGDFQQKLKNHFYKNWIKNEIETLNNDFYYIISNSFKMDLLPTQIQKKIEYFIQILNTSNYHLKFYYQIYSINTENFQEYPSNNLSETKFGYPFIFEYQCKDYLHFQQYLSYFKLNSNLSPHEFFFLFKSIMLHYQILYLKLQKQKKFL